MPMGTASGRSVYFGVFEFDLNARNLYRRGVKIDLQPQAGLLLDLFLERPNQVVTRDEIHNRLWPGQGTGEFDSRINFEVKQIRDALRDDPHNLVFIETIPKRGYRFIGQVQLTDGRPLSPESSTTPLDRLKMGKVHGIPHERWQPKLRWQRSSVALAMVIIGGVIALGVVAMRARMINRPVIAFMTPILQQRDQTILIRGHGLGNYTGFTNADAPFLCIRDYTAGWSAGRIFARNFDEVTLTVVSWTDSEIVVTGFGGAYNKGSWKLNAGDEIQVAVWNPQTGAGPATYSLHVGPPITSH